MKAVALELQPCCGQRSGIGTFTYELTRRLNNCDDLCFKGNIFNFLGRNDNSNVIKSLSYETYETKIVPYGIYRRLWNFVPFDYSCFFGNSNLSIFFNYIIPPNIDGKVITTVYDLVYKRFPETVNKRNLVRISNDIDYSLRRSDKIITISEFSKSEIINYHNVPEDKITVIPCAPSPAADAADWDKVQRKYNISDNFILFIGTIEPRKNLVKLINAFEILKAKFHIPHQLVLAGGKGWNNETILSCVSNSLYQSEIIFTGFISGSEKTALLRHAAVFVFPSIYEGFGIPPLEAMQLGCPVVCSNAASIPEAVGDASLLFDPYDEGQLADSIYKVIDSEKIRSDLISAGYKQAKKFSWDDSAKKLIQLCKETLE